VRQRGAGRKRDKERKLKMKTGMWLVALVVLMANVAMAGDWSFTPLGGDEMITLRMGYTPTESRVTIGPEFTWIDGIDSAEGTGWALGFFGAYDVVKDAEFELLGVSAPINWYIGVHADVLFPEDEKADATAGLMTGLRFGDGDFKEGQTVAASLGVEFQYLLTDELWKELAPINDESRLLAFVTIKVKAKVE